MFARMADFWAPIIGKPFAVVLSAFRACVAVAGRAPNICFASDGNGPLPIDLAMRVEFATHLLCVSFLIGLDLLVREFLPVALWWRRPRPDLWIRPLGNWDRNRVCPRLLDRMLEKKEATKPIHFSHARWLAMLELEAGASIWSSYFRSWRVFP